MKQKTWHKNGHLGAAFSHALRGLREAFGAEGKLWIALACAVAALAAGLWLKLSALALALIVLVSAAVIAGEIANTALESLEDIVSPEYHEAVRRSKDLAAGAVLTLILAAAAVGLLLFFG